MGIIRGILIFFVRAFFSLYFALFGKPKISANLQKTVSLYSGAGFTELFATIRSWDAPFETINLLTPKSGSIVDLGCGDGILTNYLAISEQKRKLLGVELNNRRIQEADKQLKNTKFVGGNILKIKIPNADAVLLAHVLHHLPTFADQKKLLANVRKSLKKNGKLIIVEIDKKPVFKYIFTWLIDVIAVPILFDGKLVDTKIHYRSLDDWQKLLESLNFRVKKYEAHKNTPFSSVIFVCEKLSRAQ